MSRIAGRLLLSFDFIPLFFLAVNIGQVSKTFPDTTPFLQGQGYVAFQLPVSLMFAVATATSGLALVTEIDLGYFDKLLVAPIRRSSIIFGRLAADLVRGIGVSTLVLLVALAFGATMRSGVLGALVLIALAALWGVAYAGIGMLVALGLLFAWQAFMRWQWPEWYIRRRRTWGWAA